MVLVFTNHLPPDSVTRLPRRVQALLAVGSTVALPLPLLLAKRVEWSVLVLEAHPHRDIDTCLQVDISVVQIYNDQAVQC